jgi:hypothetical protein
MIRPARKLARSCALLLGVLLYGAPLMALPGARAADSGRVTLLEENDFFAPDNRDRHYTQGAQLDYLSPALGESGLAAPMRWLGQHLPVFQDGTVTARHFDLFLGQELFTPTDKKITPPDPHDRPYAGWLNGGVGLLQDSDRRLLDHLELQFGLVGPTALAKQTQNNFHLAINDPQSNGWGYQLRDEPTANLYYDRHYRFLQPISEALALDVIPAGGFALGNAFDYLAVGARIRFGRNLAVDYGPPRIGPGPSGTGYFDKSAFVSDDKFGWYVFLGTEGRAVGRNIFLDGNSFVASRSIPKRPLVGDLEAGAAVFYSDWLRLTYSYLNRSDEFYGQHNPDDFGSLTLSFVWVF